VALTAGPRRSHGVPLRSPQVRWRDQASDPDESQADLDGPINACIVSGLAWPIRLTRRRRATERIWLRRTDERWLRPLSLVFRSPGVARSARLWPATRGGRREVFNRFVFRPEVAVQDADAGHRAFACWAMSSSRAGLASKLNRGSFCLSFKSPLPSQCIGGTEIGLDREGVPGSYYVLRSMKRAAVMRNTKVVSISLPAEMLEVAESIARHENRTMSELMREALRHTSGNASHGKTSFPMARRMRRGWHPG